MLLPFFSTRTMRETGFPEAGTRCGRALRNYGDFGGTTRRSDSIGLRGGLTHTPVMALHSGRRCCRIGRTAQRVFVQTYSDPSRPPAPPGCTGGGSLNLQPETATTYSAGLSAEQAATSTSLLQHQLQESNLSYLSDLTICSRKARALITRCPSAECTSLINQYVLGPVFGRSSQSECVQNGTELNLGTTKTQGFFRTYSIPTDTGRFRGSGRHPAFQYDVACCPTVPVPTNSTTLDSHCARLRGNAGWAIAVGDRVCELRESHTHTESPRTSISFTTVLNLLF